MTSLTVVVVRPSGPVNLGQIARCCSNLGIDDLRLVSPLCQVNCSDSRKFAVNAREFLLAAPVFDSLEKAVADCSVVIGTSGLEHASIPCVAPESLLPWLVEKGVVKAPAVAANNPGRDGGEEEGAACRRQTEIDEGTEARTDSESKGDTVARYCVVFGNESSGLNSQELGLCQAYLNIPSRGTNPSYNLGHAVLAVLYTLSRARFSAPPATTPAAARPAAARPAKREQVNWLLRYCMGTLDRSGYFRCSEDGKTSRRAHFERNATQGLSAMPLTARSINVLTGLLAHFNLVAFGSAEREMGRTGVWKDSTVSSKSGTS